MAADVNKEIELEIAHVLFIDIVGYSKLLIDEQRDYLHTLNELVRATEAFRTADAAGKLTTLPTGDGMALVFATTPDAPAVCALQIAKGLQSHPDLRVRMGIHSGPVSGTVDVSQRANIAGAGINMAQRVMDCGDAGHILLSKRVADDLEQLRQWREHLHELGECEVKHGVRICVVNLYKEGLGNPELPEKFKRPAGQEIQGPTVHGQGRTLALTKWAALAAVVLLLAAAGFWLYRSRPSPKVPDGAIASSSGPIATPALTISEKSIAVLPFENLSRDPDNAFFTEGMQDEILTNLAKIADLKVISRTSVIQYKSGITRNLREIGKELGVSHLLEGSVQRVSNRVRINAQLINAQTDAHVWAESYDRDLADVFAIQSELAKTIAGQLRVNLTPLEQKGVATKPTENPEAYVLYLRARELEIRFRSANVESEAAAKLYQQAVDLDPKFALARARLSYRITFNTQGRDSPRMAKALSEAEEALRLQPNLGEARLALAYYYYWGKKDPDRALAELSSAEKLIPNSAEVWNIRGQVYRRQNRFRERIAALQHAETLNPRDTYNLVLLWATFRAVRNWPDALRTRDRVAAVSEGAPVVFWGTANVEFCMSGGIEPLKKAISGAPNGTRPGRLSLARYELAMLERDYPAAERFLRETPEEIFGDWREDAPKVMEEAFLAVARGADPAAAEQALGMAHQEIEKRLTDDPDKVKLHGALGLIDAFRGRKEDAIREGRRWVELEDYSMLEKNDAAANLALIYARVGEPDEAIKLIEKLLTVPANLDHLEIFSMTQADLKWRWVWDPLRGDPRFQKILEGPEPQTVY